MDKRKISAVCATVAALAALCVSGSAAFAADGTLTLNAGDGSTLAGHSFTVYKLANYTDVVKDGANVKSVSASSPDATVNPKLCGFRRVHLDRNEEKEIQIDLPASALQVCSDEGVWHRGSGRWDLYAAFGQPDPRTQELTGKPAAHCVIE